MAPMIRASVVALLVATIVSVGASQAAAQASGSLELVAQSSWVDDGGIFNLQVRAAGADAGATVLVNVHPPHGSRTELITQPAFTDAPLLQVGPLSLGDLQGTSNEVLALEIAIAGPGIDPSDSEQDDERDIPVLETEADSAVYPIEIVLQNEAGVISDTIRTTLIKLPRGVGSSPLQVVLLLDSQLPLALTETGESVLEEIAGAELLQILDALALHPDAAVALSLSPEALVALDRSDFEMHAALMESIGRQIQTDELFAAPYVPVDEQAWINAGLDVELAQLYTSGQEAVRIVSGIEPDRSVAVLDETLTPDGLDWMVDQGVQGVIVNSAQLSRLDPAIFDPSITRRFLIPTASGRTVPALQSDDQLTGHFAETANEVLNANRMLADLTLLALDETTQRRTVVVTPPADWQPKLAFLNVLLSGLERIPVLAAATPSDALANTDFMPAAGDGTISPPLRRELQPSEDAVALGGFRTEYNQAAAAIGSWQSVIAADPDSTRLLAELLLVSADERLAPEQRSAYVDTIYRVIDEQKTSAISTPSSDPLTITGRETTVPLVVENDLDVAVAVLLVLDSEKLFFPDGREVAVILEPGQNRIEIPIEARASGDSPIRVQILSPDRSVLLGSTEVLVRTFAFSGVGVFIGIGAIIVLLLWWLRQRRSGRDTLQAARDNIPSPPEALSGVLNP